MHISKPNSLIETRNTDNFIRVWHLVIIILCLVAWLTGDMANDYKKIEYSGFIYHGLAGMAFTFALSLYIGYGIVGPKPLRFTQWFPFTNERMQKTKADLVDLIRFKLPEHERRQGVAGLVQYLGMVVFFWIAITGTLLYVFIEPGSKTKGLLHGVKEAHEIGEILIPLYLGLHIGAVIAHSLTGNNVWRDIFFAKKDL
ncbi:MAG: cytochrome b/b6 domain-containing protein [Desulfobulbaceae bacterium]|nr:cytochrome b/b6 domain-containing protein [Desulfobulbaceae bacterium]